MALKIEQLPDNEKGLLQQLQRQMESNKGGHETYLEAERASDDDAMRHNKPSHEAYLRYEAEYEREAKRLGVAPDPKIPSGVDHPRPQA